MRNIKVCLLSVVAVLFALRPAEAERPLAVLENELVYKIYVGGFHIIGLDVGIKFEPSVYHVNATIKSVGTIEWLFPWSMMAYAVGGFHGTKVKPRTAGQENNWRGKKRYAHLKFEHGEVKIVRIRPKLRTDDREPVSEDMRRGTLDLMSAIIGLITRLHRNEPCDGMVRVFDGRRRYDLIAKSLGNKTLLENRYTPFVGPVVQCRLSINKIAGFKKTDSSDWKGLDRSARVWMGRPFVDAPPVPIRLRLETPIGGLVAHLTLATGTVGGKKRSLIKKKRKKVK
ncbi:MAG: DUF3108 domain-containing protein [Pseudomonadota bacterium]|nr:DUF3108 domain-containing protein [Pseudomonadota bacterium]